MSPFWPGSAGEPLRVCCKQATCCSPFLFLTVHWLSAVVLSRGLQALPSITHWGLEQPEADGAAGGTGWGSAASPAVLMVSSLPLWTTDQPTKLLSLLPSGTHSLLILSFGLTAQGAGSQRAQPQTWPPALTGLPRVAATQESCRTPETSGKSDLAVALGRGVYSCLSLPQHI